MIWLVTSSPDTGGVSTPTSVPLEYVNVASGVILAKPTPPNTYGDTCGFTGIVQRKPPIEYHAGTRASPVTESPPLASVSVTASTAGCACDGCRLWNCPMSPKTER
jgi:hypothetical protein